MDVKFDKPVKAKGTLDEMRELTIIGGKLVSLDLGPAWCFIIEDFPGNIHGTARWEAELVWEGGQLSE
jgi:hypothetical protein